MSRGEAAFYRPRAVHHQPPWWRYRPPQRPCCCLSAREPQKSLSLHLPGQKGEGVLLKLARWGGRCSSAVLNLIAPTDRPTGKAEPVTQANQPTSHCHCEYVSMHFYPPACFMMLVMWLCYSVLVLSLFCGRQPSTHHVQASQRGAWGSRDVCSVHAWAGSR